MSYKIIVDSCGELPENMKKDPHFESVPLSMQVDNFNIIDDDTFDQKDFLKKLRESPNGPKSACPSPERYMEAYKGDAENIYVVTLSEQLSGSYNSAELGKTLYLENNPPKKIKVFNSKSASVGETLVAMKIEELEKAGQTFERIVELVDKYVEEMKTYFVLETLETLRKNGRLTGIKAFVASALNIKPVMGATQEGAIYQIDQARGMKKALTKMISAIENKTQNCEEKILGIAHCNCLERAMYVKDELKKRCNFKDIFIIDTAGISTMYANDGGIIVVV